MLCSLLTFPSPVSSLTIRFLSTRSSPGNVAKRAFRAHPLVDLLIVCVSNICVQSQITHVANDQRLHACLMQRGDEARGLLVLDRFDLMFELLELFLLGADDPLAPLAAFLHTAVNARVEYGLQLVAVLHFGTQEPPVEDVRLGAVMGGGHMHLAQVYPSHLPRWERSVEGWLLVGGDGLVLRARPVDDHCLGQVPGPGEEQRGIAFAIGEAKLPVVEEHRGLLVFNAKEALALVRRFRVGVACLFAFPPTFEGGGECLNTGVGSMSVQCMGGEQPFQVLLFEKETLVPDGAPEEHQRVAVEFTALAGEGIKLFTCAESDAAYIVLLHRMIFFFPVAKAVKPLRTRSKANEKPALLLLLKPLV